MGVGRITSFFPDYGKGKMAADKLFSIIDRVPAIDTESQEGLKPVSFSCDQAALHIVIAVDLRVCVH